MAEKKTAEEEEERKRVHVIMLTSAVMGHVIPLGELARRLCTDFNCRVTIILVTSSSNRSLSTQEAPLYLDRLCSLCSHIHVQNFEIQNQPNQDDSSIDLDCLIRECLLPLRQILSRSAVRALVTTVVFTSYIKEMKEVGIPTYIFLTTSAAFLSLLLWLPDLMKQISVPFGELEFGIQLPGLPAMAAKDFPRVFMDPSDSVFRMLRNAALDMREGPPAAGILVNSFDSLEDPALLLRKEMIPLTYNIGPIVRTDQAEDKEAQCLTWLDQQPQRSVLFLCFGSIATVSEPQIRQIEQALDNSKQRFLWILRRPPGAEAEQKKNAGLFANQRGLVTETWVPQLAILQHAAIAGFVSHCGWNSTLESICCGVPIIPWPVAAEQATNALMIVQVYGVGVPLQRDDDGFVKAEYLEKAIVQLMEGEQGARARERALLLKHKASEALQCGGSSSKAMAEFGVQLEMGVSH